MASSSSMTLDSAAISPFPNRNFEQEAVYIAHEHVADTTVSNVRIDALEHSARCTVGEREAQHIGIRHPSTSWARRMRSVSICVLPQPGDASTR